MSVSTDHKLTQADWRSSPHCAPRPDWAQIELVVIHCISLPEDQFGTGAPERLFLGTLDVAEHESFADLEGVEVAPHLLITREGRVVQFVAFDQQAWHAGLSSWCGRVGCNAYSVGIELEGSVNTHYTDAQYKCLVEVLVELFRAYPGLSVERVVGHQDIAPDRKFDPGPHFDWPALYSALYERAVYT